MQALKPAFYARPVLDVARDLLGCIVQHDGAAGVIVETEAYHESEPACHAFVGLTPRTRTLFGPPGHAYVYRSYGVHALLNAVCEGEGVGAAVLIRALEPLAGLRQMRERRSPRPRTRACEGLDERSSDQSARVPARAPADDRELCSGPGKLTQALGVQLSENGCQLSRGPVLILAPSARWRDPAIVVGGRIGITRAAELPWRFCVAGNAHVSRPRPPASDGQSWQSRGACGRPAGERSRRGRRRVIPLR